MLKRLVKLVQEDFGQESECWTDKKGRGYCERPNESGCKWLWFIWKPWELNWFKA